VFGTQGKKWKMEREAYFSLFPLFETYRGKEENKKIYIWAMPGSIFTLFLSMASKHCIKA